VVLEVEVQAPDNQHIQKLLIFLNPEHRLVQVVTLQSILEVAVAVFKQAAPHMQDKHLAAVVQVSLLLDICIHLSHYFMEYGLQQTHTQKLQILRLV
jgi:hypothetical protein